MKNVIDSPDNLNWISIRQKLMLALSTAFAFSLLVNLFMLAIPVYSLQIFDRVTVSQSQETLVMLLVAVCICIITMLGFEILRRKLLLLTANNISSSLTRFSLDQQGQKNLQHSDSSAHPENANIAHQYFDFEALSRMTKNVRSPAILALMDATLTPAFITLLFFLHPAFAITTTIINLVLVAICRYQFTLIQTHSSVTPVNTKRALRWLKSEYDSHWAQGEQHQLIDGLQSNIRADQELKDEQTSTHNRLTTAILIVRNFGQIAIPTVGALLLIQQLISPGIMLAAIILSMKGLIPWEQVFHHSHTLKELFEDLKKLKFSSQQGELNQPCRHAPITDLSGSLSLSITSKATQQQLSVSPGSLTAIVGPNGSGKSSLLKAIIGLPQQTSFTVTTRYDEYAVESIDRSYFSGKLAYIPCASAAPHLSVRELILDGSTQEADALYDLCRLLGLHNRLLKLPLGYDTVIDENAVTQSGGVLHLILLARALQKKPKFLFLDNLDATFDKNGVECFERVLPWLKDHAITTIITTQRKSLLGHCDNVLLCDQDSVFYFSQNDGNSAPPSLSSVSLQGDCNENSM
mgnify:CR=1 FL=1